MPPLPRNERRRTPREGARVIAPAPPRARAVRVSAVWIPPPTPTPPPVVIGGPPAAARPSAAPARPAPRIAPRRSSGPARAVLAVVFALAVIGGSVSRLSGAAGGGREPAREVAAAGATLPVIAALHAVAATAQAPSGSIPSAAAPAPPRAAPAAAEPPPAPRADARFRRDGYDTVRGGVVYFPATFASADGAYDLVLQFHGNVKIVVESAEVAGLNAITAIINLGIGSQRYMDAYGVPGSYEALLAEVQRVIEGRGLEGARLRRVALSAWSAGYGAVSTILEVRRKKDPLDAILVQDGIHCGWLAEQKEALNHRQLAPFARAAKAAVEGKILFSLTHSEIDPITYASTAATASWLARSVGAERRPSSSAPPYLRLRSMEGAVARRLEKTMDPTTEAHAGDLHVRGFKGHTAEHHMAHLFQMAATLLPELVARWSTLP